MIKKIVNSFYLVIFFICIFVVLSYYFSEKNIININKSRSVYPNKIMNEKLKNLPILKNDTDNIISYSSDIDDFKKNKKIFKFFELLKKK
jgi:hypothetical protein